MGDITLVHADGTFVPFYSRSIGSFSTFQGPAESNVSVVGEKVVSNPDPVTTAFYSGDQIGSTTILTDSDGWPVSSEIYYPFGQEPTPMGGNNHYKSTGKERDTESGLDYFGARYYGSSMGRFMSPDPGKINPKHLANPQKWNKYAYVLNNPLAMIDPDGQEELRIHIGRLSRGRTSRISDMVMAGASAHRRTQAQESPLRCMPGSTSGVVETGHGPNIETPANERAGNR